MKRSRLERDMGESSWIRSSSNLFGVKSKEAYVIRLFTCEWILCSTKFHAKSDSKTRKRENDETSELNISKRSKSGSSSEGGEAGDCRAQVTPCGQRSRRRNLLVHMACGLGVPPSCLPHCQSIILLNAYPPDDPRSTHTHTDTRSLLVCQSHCWFSVSSLQSRLSAAAASLNCVASQAKAKASSFRA